MKSNRTLLMVILWVIFSFPLYSQKVLSIGKDTVVAITPEQLSTINGIIADYEITGKTLALSRSLLKLDSVSIATRDSVISELERSVVYHKDYIDTQKNSMSQLESEISRMKRKNKLKNSIITIALATTLGILILK